MKRLSLLIVIALVSLIPGVIAFFSEQDGNLERYLIKPDGTNQTNLTSNPFAEEVTSQIVLKVRENSGKLIRLTPVSSLGGIIPGVEADGIEAILKDEGYQDIRLITNSKNTQYLYSENAMTRTYAEILARVGANDPVTTIAETVRDQSRNYPSPTKLDLFRDEIFNINPDELEKHLADLLRNPEYEDIQQVKASTGVIYLYSTLYIKSEDWVKSMIEWWEVGRFENP